VITRPSSRNVIQTTLSVRFYISIHNTFTAIYVVVSTVYYTLPDYYDFKSVPIYDTHIKTLQLFKNIMKS